MHKPRCEKRHDKLLERIGRLKEKSRGASQHYHVSLTTDDTGQWVTALTWEKSLVPGTLATHPGMYGCPVFRSSRVSTVPCFDRPVFRFRQLSLASGRK